MNWINVKDRLPENDHYVLWLHENGMVFYDALDKDMDFEYIKYFLNGNSLKEIAGPILYWCEVEYPDSYADTMSE